MTHRYLMALIKPNRLYSAIHSSAIDSESQGYNSLQHSSILHDKLASQNALTETIQVKQALHHNQKIKLFCIGIDQNALQRISMAIRHM